MSETIYSSQINALEFWTKNIELALTCKLCVDSIEVVRNVEISNFEISALSHESYQNTISVALFSSVLLYPFFRKRIVRDRQEIQKMFFDKLLVNFAHGSFSLPFTSDRQPIFLLM